MHSSIGPKQHVLRVLHILEGIDDTSTVISSINVPQSTNNLPNNKTTRKKMPGCNKEIAIHQPSTEEPQIQISPMEQIQSQQQQQTQQIQIPKPTIMNMDNDSINFTSDEEEVKIIS